MIHTYGEDWEALDYNGVKRFTRAQRGFKISDRLGFRSGYNGEFCYHGMVSYGMVWYGMIYLFFIDSTIPWSLEEREELGTVSTNCPCHG